MTAYIIRRLLLIPILLLAVTMIVFSMSQLLGPNKLMAAYVNPNVAERMSPEQWEDLKEKYGLNDPLPIRYAKWLGNTLQGDLGWSQVGAAPVLEAITSRLPYSIEIALWALLPILGFSIWLGVKVAVRQNSWLDHTARIVVLIGWSLPDFVFGIFILLLTYGVLGWFPPGILSNSSQSILASADYHQITNILTLDAILNWRWDVFIDAIRHLIAPVLTISYLWWAFLVRITRASMLEVLRKDYVRTARAKGVSEKNVINKHAKKNALIPVVTVSGQMIIGLIMGVIIVETVFNRPGFGRLTAQAAQRLDYSTVMGSLLFSAMIMIVGNLIIDIIYALIDPRIRLE
ncbi:MAG: ABC transporter permease [Thermotogota bacterium]